MMMCIIIEIPAISRKQRDYEIFTDLYVKKKAYYKQFSKRGRHVDRLMPSVQGGDFLQMD